jgi:hypothetical protein
MAWYTVSFSFLGSVEAFRSLIMAWKCLFPDANEYHYHPLKYRPLDTCYGYYKTESFHHFRGLSKLLFLSVDVVTCSVCVTIEGLLDNWIY